MPGIQSPCTYFTKPGPRNTAVVLRAANAQDFFDLRFLEIICVPAQGLA